MSTPPEYLHSHGVDAPSEWVARWGLTVPAGCAVLDVACGGGRHARYFAKQGHTVEAVDRDSRVLTSLAGIKNISTRCADLESGPWPYGVRTFGAIVVTNYLYRPLFPHLLEALAEGGVFICETFAAGNERFGRPSRPEFLLRPGELLDVVRGQLRVIAFEDLFVEGPKPAMVQRICAVRTH
jgi:SAM-dependent methyltransferase